MTTFRERSIAQWTGNPTVENINAGSLQRIADACERMAGNYIALQNERDRYKRWYQEALQNREAAERRASALRGVITKMKRKT